MGRMGVGVFAGGLCGGGFVGFLGGDCWGLSGGNEEEGIEGYWVKGRRGFVVGVGEMEGDERSKTKTKTKSKTKTKIKSMIKSKSRNMIMKIDGNIGWFDEETLSVSFL